MTSGTRCLYEEHVDGWLVSVCSVPAEWMGTEWEQGVISSVMLCPSFCLLGQMLILLLGAVLVPALLQVLWVLLA